MNNSSPIEDLFDDPKSGHLLTRAIIDTIREPLLVLDTDLRGLVASPSFYTSFKTLPSDTEGRLVYELGNGQWNIPALRGLLKGVIPDHATVDAFEVEHDFPTLGRRTMVLSSREIRYENGQKKALLLFTTLPTDALLKRNGKNLSSKKTSY